MVEFSQKIQIAKIVAKDQVYKVQEKWQTSKSGKNSLTKDPALMQQIQSTLFR